MKLRWGWAALTILTLAVVLAGPGNGTGGCQTNMVFYAKNKCFWVIRFQNWQVPQPVFCHTVSFTKPNPIIHLNDLMIHLAPQQLFQHTLCGNERDWTAKWDLLHWEGMQTEERLWSRWVLIISFKGKGQLVSGAWKVAKEFLFKTWPNKLHKLGVAVRDTGDTGETGGTVQTGLTGRRGHRGNRNDRGERGDKGQRGDRGQRGHKGHRWHRGDMSERANDFKTWSHWDQ